ncbi:peptidase M23 [Hanstruepera neustonica]|uniref:Peptidase M23 n=1 Tax=Hanstruepera neustonica TaxID=1445657 RepID=A0A2K1DWD7_9FLAO|nr:M23 family metallopeptidase [Hanstruepera neustonica]PNQ72299.1 peptidase M23 [Hanstruepera neustonica]
MRKLLFLLLLFYTLGYSQNPYPQDYFRAPLDISLIPSGTFGELRSNHFHSGLDIKTQQREGLSVYAIADGYVSRIKVSHYGYGKALYITHPNGYVSVYGHLQKYAPEIESYIKNLQYEQETFEIEVFPNPIEIPVHKSDIVAYTGNTGGSGGPHLHFEIRDNQERPINPLLFGLEIQDNTRPTIKEVYAYPLSNDAHINSSKEKQKLRLIPLQNGDYSVENIEAYGKIGFGIETIDRQDLATNQNGVSNIQGIFNGNLMFEIDFKRFSFDETRHINRLIDYKHYKEDKTRIQKLFVEPENPLSMYKNLDNNGYLRVEDSTNSVYKIKVNDFHNNPTWLTINIEGKKTDDIKSKPDSVTPFFIYAKKNNELLNKNVSVNFPENTFYDDFYVDFNVRNDTLTLHEDIVPVRDNFSISFDITNYEYPESEKLYIARLVGYKNQYALYSSTKKKENKLTTYTQTLGTYALVLDTINPKIKPVNFSKGKWLSKYRFLKIKIEDNESGISNYRATLNGKWILMEYDYKKNELTYDFNDAVSTETENNLKVIVTDNVGNSSTFETLFYRK